jgi:hypothetical protein
MNNVVVIDVVHRGSTEGCSEAITSQIAAHALVAEKKLAFFTPVAA